MSWFLPGETTISGGAFIAKHLDHILVVESLLSVVGRYRSWVEIPYISDHAPVIAQFDFSQTRVAYPFKLNPTWLVEQDFSLIVKEVWGDSIFLEEVDIQLRFVWKLKTLKSRIKDWARHTRREKLRKLETLEEDISRGFSELTKVGFDTVAETHLKTLESECNDLLRIEEEH
jgi:hypothetical protein